MLALASLRTRSLAFLPTTTFVKGEEAWSRLCQARAPRYRNERKLRTVATAVEINGAMLKRNEPAKVVVPAMRNQMATYSQGTSPSYHFFSVTVVPGS